MPRKPKPGPRKNARKGVTVKTTLYLDEELHQFLRWLAWRHETNGNTIIEGMLRDYHAIHRKADPTTPPLGVVRKVPSEEPPCPT